ncbi:class I SAM-dependent methyltransferase [Geodermatophilus poikilotrophus]|uniref:LicD family protein n=1 Tax=Geodermatophilus poikilotrophus TaxID=1333667 RepID=A0A1I0H3T1_9ACTN|nr:class I SAM-dependent methyltransferase [Geodermatophilus poikilotrophus]SET78221.1 LicD family protein [Geodermatophilus poikilotrophus]
MSSSPVPEADSSRLSADRSTLTVDLGRPGAFPDVVDVVIQGFRTVSLRADAAARVDERSSTWEWPDALARVLSGRAELTVRDAATKRVLASGSAAFGDSTDPLDLTDAQGRWLSVNKWGRLAPSFDGLTPSGAQALQDRLLARLDRVRADLEDLGLSPFVCYGTLLGARRDGDLIPHDDDADLAYLSAHENPADVVRENLELERALRARGHEITRHSGGHLQLVFGGDDAGFDHYIDIFTAFVTGERTYLCFQVGADHLDLRGRSEVTIRGRPYPAPADVEALLAATYGPGWRTPDPSFTFTTPYPVRSRLSTWIGEFGMQRDYWEDFYGSADVDRVPPAESGFASWVTQRLPETAGIVDVGTGTARDARFFARSGRRVLAVDYSSAAIDRGRDLARREGWAADFEVVNLADLHQVAELAAGLDPHVDWHLYARFLIHAIDDQARSNLWTLAGAVARRGGECWFEFRTSRDEREQHVFGEHFRRYLDPEHVALEAKERELKVLELVEGRGLAPYGDEDPWVARMRIGAV